MEDDEVTLTRKRNAHAHGRASSAMTVQEQRQPASTAKRIEQESRSRDGLRRIQHW